VRIIDTSANADEVFSRIQDLLETWFSAKLHKR
jgi:hypothetical protein